MKGPSDIFNRAKVLKPTPASSCTMQTFHYATRGLIDEGVEEGWQKVRKEEQI